MPNKPPESKAKWKQGQFEFTRFRMRKTPPKTSAASPVAAEPQPLDGDPQHFVPANVGVKDQLTGSSLAELAPDAHKRDPNKNAGHRCQAPKGNGICGSVISALNPYTNIPVCQPCAERLMHEAVRMGRDPDLGKYWRWLEGKRKSQAAQLERPSGVRETPTQPASAETAPVSQNRPVTDAPDVVLVDEPKVAVA